MNSDVHCLHNYPQELENHFATEFSLDDATFITSISTLHCHLIPFLCTVILILNLNQLSIFYPITKYLLSLEQVSSVKGFGPQ